MKGMKIKQNSANFHPIRKACTSKKPTLPYIRFGFKCGVIFLMPKRDVRKTV